MYIYRESQKTWDLEDDLKAFNRHSSKIETNMRKICVLLTVLFKYLIEA